MKQKPHREGEFAVASTLRNRNLQLSAACKSGDAKVVSQLIKAKVSINTPVTKYENTPLTLACYYGFDDIVKLLVDAGADVNKKNANKKTPLQIVCSIYEGNAKKIERIVKILLKNGANPNLFKRNEDGPIHYASMYGYAEAVKLLIKHDVDVKKRGSYKRTALIYAATDSCSQEIIKSLLDAGADINAKNEAGENALFELITREKPDNKIAELLIEKGINIHAESKYSGTALHCASFCGREKIAKTLIKNGAKINYKGKKGSLPINEAMGQSKTKVVKLLFENGANATSSSIFGTDLLQYAAAKHDLEFAKKIIEKLKKEKKSHTSGAMSEAAATGDLEMVKFLFEAGILPDATRGWGSETPLMRAAYHGKIKVVKYLLEKDADIKARDYRGNTPLLHAAWAGHLNVVKVLLKNGAEISENNKLNWNALMQACIEGHYKLAEFLLKKDSPVNEVDKEKGATALTLAKFIKNKKLIDLLISYGAKEREVTERKENEDYFSIFDCDICFYIPHKKRLAERHVPEKFEGLEIFYKEDSQPDRYTDNVEMIKKCKNCGTFYHHNYSYDDEDSFISGPHIYETMQRYNFERLRLVLGNLKNNSELKEFNNRYSELIKTFELELQKETINENFLPYEIESLTDFYINNNDWNSLKTNLLQHKNEQIILDTAKDLVLMNGAVYSDRKFPDYREYRDCTVAVKEKTQILLKKNKKEFLKIVHSFKGSSDVTIQHKYDSIVSNLKYYKL